mgnify:CR=1 FL=1
MSIIIFIFVSDYNVYNYGSNNIKNIRNIYSRKIRISLRSLVKSMGGSIKVRKEKKCGLDEALEDVKAGRIYHAESTEDMMKQIFG